MVLLIALLPHGSRVSSDKSARSKVDSVSVIVTAFDGFRVAKL